MAKSSVFETVKATVGAWITRVVGEALSSKKTLAAGGAVASIIVYVKSIDKTLAVICATIVVVAWLAAQAYVDGKKINK